MKRNITSPEERFWAKVVKTKSCWLWQGAGSKSRYGRLRVENGMVSTHRYSYQLHKGMIPAGLYVCHTCDRPACVNPQHLFLGTAQDNQDDCVKKGRTAAGDRNGSRLHPENRPRGDHHFSRTNPEKLLSAERHGRAKLSNAEVMTIRRIYAERKNKRGSFVILAAKYGVSAGAISHIIHGQSWRSVT